MPPDHQLISGYQTTYGHRTCPFVTNSKCSLKRFLFEPEAHGAHERVHISSLCTLLHLLFVDRVDKKTFVNLIGAQLLGPALSAGAIYVASVLESSTDILCIKGNYCPSRYSTTVVTSSNIRLDNSNVVCAPLHLFLLHVFASITVCSLRSVSIRYTSILKFKKQSNVLNKLLRTFGFCNCW